MLIKSRRNNTNQYDQFFFGRGKLLLTGEYFVLDGATSLALPLKVGQALTVEYAQSYSPKLHWRSFDVNGNLWLDCRFEFWRFNCLDERVPKEIELLQTLLRQARKQNPHFLRDEVDVYVTTKLGFPLEWGLGSSSSLIYNIAQWAYISPFELLFNTYGGSGYDIACAQSDGPILYEKQKSGPNWSPTKFNPPFSDKLYFVYRGTKQDSQAAILRYNQSWPYPPEAIYSISEITKGILEAKSLDEFNFLIAGHEKLVAKYLKLIPVKEEFFADYWGEIKSLGAWGGDFILVTSDRSYKETKAYFEERNFNICIPYKDLVLSEDSCKATVNTTSVADILAEEVIPLAVVNDGRAGSNVQLQ
ncbi:MAG: hypothetical protein A2504_01235 [Bdellovibrionales bacterium RIFOXYD12_FULL_39_22]|nr:MAG: hypothetical protein A2385_02125 [Bdellovibrionales bacterium RIFOXYB1_FULL_39_21]OFZ42731.1 MAG: hypothetical protein A2485_10310 [Bdellovibrionales bacterium RIFOXYC12_FULL_39_17]OFZ47290.1 MAG: hypothetical protein A2404_14915 [Bdellovibrionales bacterium RIFOXYC1_FULL_39_130]OFZ75456.1 MAG: hypothetical protein A2560_04185 [Bdellovibrionales bacterium RIFOXYD1_FULL_39_84]OFZ93410.1 MAG: hypothetical protein A2504_01235 [Bdellovibrionales bacterium RIFOXYD12_FULL_39_22]HLE12381.1 GY